jgi:hypothetical protein
MIWAIIVVAFAVFGYMHDGRTGAASIWLVTALRGILMWGGLGVGIATCVSAALTLLARIKSKRLAWSGAIAIFFCVCAASVGLPFLVMSAPGALGSPDDPFHGESGILVLGMSLFMFWVALIAFLLFIPCAIAFTAMTRKPS